MYERGVQIFKYPHVREIWTTYLSKFVSRYGGKKLERARDLFEQAVEKVCGTLVFNGFSNKFFWGSFLIYIYKVFVLDTFA